MIAYTKHCLPCTHKAELKELKLFAAKNRLSLEVRQVTYKKEWQKEANNLAKYHKVEFPFVHHDGKAVHITDDLSKLVAEPEPAQEENTDE